MARSHASQGTYFVAEVNPNYQPNIRKQSKFPLHKTVLYKPGQYCIDTALCVIVCAYEQDGRCLCVPVCPD